MLNKYLSHKNYVYSGTLKTTELNSEFIEIQCITHPLQLCQDVVNPTRQIQLQPRQVLLTTIDRDTSPSIFQYFSPHFPPPNYCCHKSDPNPFDSQAQEKKIDEKI